MPPRFEARPPVSLECSPINPSLSYHKHETRPQETALAGGGRLLRPGWRDRRTTGVGAPGIGAGGERMHDGDVVGVWTTHCGVRARWGGSREIWRGIDPPIGERPRPTRRARILAGQLGIDAAILPGFSAAMISETLFRNSGGFDLRECAVARPMVGCYKLRCHGSAGGGPS